MRWLLDIAVLLAALGIAGGVVMYRRIEDKQEKQIDRAAAEVRRFELEIKYRAASRIGELNARGWPVTVDPAWFDGRAPENLLVSMDRPWVEIAPPEDMELHHPLVRLAIDESMAAFWYNPSQGVIRARVPVMATDDESLKLYNRINNCALGSIFQPEVPAKSGAAPPEMAAPTQPGGIPAPAAGAPSEPDLDPTKPRQPASPSAPPSATAPTDGKR